MPKPFLAATFVLLSYCVLLSSSEAAKRPRVDRASIEPHWFDDDSRFWYENKRLSGGHEFIVVDALQGIRKRAFDHQRVGTAMAKALGEKIDSKRLPIQQIEFLPNDKIRLIGRKGEWILDRSNHVLTTTDDATPQQLRSLPFNRRRRPSRRTGPETEIRFHNERKQTIELFWIDSSGEQHSYGKVGPEQSHSQHTYAGHVWLVSDLDGSTVAVFEAVKKPSDARIDNRPPDLAAESRPTKSRPDQRSQRRTGVSPLRKHSVESRDHNLWLVDKDDQAVQLTTNGSAENSWQRDTARARGVQMRYSLQDSEPKSADLRWSPDSKRFVALQTKSATERRVHLIESSPRDQLQPKLHSYPYLKPGDEIPTPQLGLFDVDRAKQIELRNDLFDCPFAIRDVRWAPDSKSFTFQYNQRGHQLFRVIRVDAVTGDVTPIVNEECDTFFDYAGKFHLQFLDETRELIWMSERDGWNHLYLIDSYNGTIKSQITSGDWVVRGVDRVDTDQRQVWFRLGGFHPDQDPYHVHFARINFDGSDLVLLTESNGTHEIDYSPQGKYLIDKWSRVDCAPVHELRRVLDGSLICELERSDTSEFQAVGQRLPTRFVAKARDGETDIYGIVHWPRNFDAKQTYPIIENIYAGPHSAHVPKKFRTSYRHQQEIADRGFVVVQIDGLGTSHRSKKFHDVCWKNIADAGLPDRILWIRALAEKYDFLDSSRVGIYGGSAGGQNALSALLSHGDFYQVAVADCGCHDNRMDKIWWNELWMSWPIGPHYEQQSNVTNAHRLNGKLLLIVGELDRNVDPASTLQVVDALIKADKDFDFLLVPGGGHGIAESPYGRRRRADFFVEHLSPPQP